MFRSTINKEIAKIRTRGFICRFMRNNARLQYVVHDLLRCKETPFSVFSIWFLMFS
ncbi:hypothetical protein HMPREF0971_01854 [Segatella oris F0302]|uniref:Uncharacterized protein n=1 Tax=Segatella oris F0302 TaxID=649760 RepID=D1QS97_9BACT|nr:hypothetical protein HMPREF0971_01854 [Segatella oris F0302]